jgi:deazaflavin-dependent oxidoreductase (nitroreductase family)
VLRRLLRAPALLYRAGFGRLLGRRFMLITHLGRRTGREYRTVVEVVGFLAATHEYVAMAGFGTSADWLRNLAAGEGREVQVGRERFPPLVRRLADDEAARVLERYEERNRLIAPLLRRVLSRLVGWRYTGTDAGRARLVRQLPMVAVRPAPRS